MTYQDFLTLYHGAKDCETLDRWLAETGVPACFEQYTADKVMPIFEAVWALREDFFAGLKKTTGTTNKSFAQRYSLPVRTVDEWSRSDAQPKSSQLLIAYAVLKDFNVL